MKRNSYIFYFIIFLRGISTSFAQHPLQHQFDFAEQLFQEKKYFDAITEYKRLLFFDSGNSFMFDANFKIGLSYKMGAKYDDAVRYIRIAERNSESAEDFRKSRFEIVRVNILRRTFERALDLLHKMERDTLFKANISEINYWRGWAFMLSDNWENAAAEFASIQTDHPLKLLCDQVVSEKYSVNFAKVISYILPGAGQFYTGNYLSGLLSLGWNVLWGYITIEAFIENRIFDGVVVGNLLWLRFYRGNFQNAEKFALEKNIEIANKALQKLKNNYKGLKP